MYLLANLKKLQYFSLYGTLCFAVNKTVNIDVSRRKSFNLLPGVQITSLIATTINIIPRN